MNRSTSKGKRIFSSDFDRKKESIEKNIKNRKIIMPALGRRSANARKVVSKQIIYVI